MTNTDLWDRLGRTDPKHTKKFKRAGGFSGTAIKPMWAYRRMTEEYGPCGKGWGVNEPSFQVVPGPAGEMLVYCTVSIWHGERGSIVFGVGGDKAVNKNAHGMFCDDEAFKKAFTDAITNALKLIGVGADVHMGLFDDNKYVNEIAHEFENAAGDESRQRFIADCKTKIAAFINSDELKAWWMSDEQMRTRRDFELSQADVDGLKKLIIDKASVLNTKKAA